MEGETFQQQALEVPQIDEETFDPNFVPQDGEEYLMKVVYERKKCPAVVVKPVKEKSKSKKDKNEAEQPSCSTNEFNDFSPEHMKPNNIWKQVQLKMFVETFNKLNQIREDMNNAPSTSTIKKQLPPIEDSDLWKKFCKENEPFLHIILNISQRDLEKLLEYESEWLKDDIEMIELYDGGNYKWLGMWIYATLTCLKQPLEPDVHSIMRNIVKSCVFLRNKLDFDFIDEAIPYNLIIYIIAQFYAQLDLLEYV